jgi:hypothetical protein
MRVETRGDYLLWTRADPSPSVRDVARTTMKQNVGKCFRGQASGHVSDNPA